MTITAKQLAKRKEYLGSSEIPAIMGFSRFANAYDTWLLKTGRVAPIEKKTDNITAGNLLETPIIRWLEQYLDKAIIVDPEQLEMPVKNTPIVDHCDGLVVDGTPVESKSEGVDHPILEPWGEAGTDEVPEYTFLQSHVHMMAYDTEICHVPTFLGGRGFGYFFVKRDENICKIIREQATKFWEENVLGDKAPENVVPSLSMIKRIRQVEGDPVRIEDELIIQRWLEAKEETSDAKKKVEFYQAKILAALDGREMGFCSLGDITNFEQNRKGYVVEPTSFRVLRLKKK